MLNEYSNGYRLCFWTATTLTASSSLCVAIADSSPTLPELLNFQGRKRKINTAREIGTRFTTFGILLLEDQTGTMVTAIADKHRGDAEQIVIEIFQKWLTGNGKSLSWKALIGVLRDTGLNVLASDIEDAF